MSSLIAKLKRYYVLNIQSRLRSRRGLWRVFSFFMLRVRRLLKIDWRDICTTDSKNIKIDIVMPTVSKDFDVLESVVASFKNICHTINKVYIISNNSEQIMDFCHRHGFVFVEESTVMGYGKSAINYRVDGLDRSGWMLQQLLKFNADTFVESDYFLGIDSDTVLLNPHVFIRSDQVIFPENRDWNKPYFDSFEKMFGYPSKNKLSFTSHMVFFEKAKLRQMKKEMEIKHNMSWDKVYLSTIDNNIMSCVSDYDTYANWMLCNYPEQTLTPPFYNKSLSRKLLGGLDELKLRYGGKYRSVSFHSYIDN